MTTSTEILNAAAAEINRDNLRNAISEAEATITVFLSDEAMAWQNAITAGWGTIAAYNRMGSTWRNACEEAIERAIANAIEIRDRRSHNEG